MRKVVLSIACSLDGFIAGPNGELDWLRFGPEAHAEVARVWSGIDVLLLGRKTYEFALKNAGEGGKSGQIETYVFSRTLARLPKPGAQLIREEAASFVRQLKAKQGGTIYLMGGGELASSLLCDGVVDEMTLNVHPVLLGGGPALFRNARLQHGLSLTSARQISNGCVLLSYATAPAQEV
jgi:dihydrofolate reductase